MSTFSLQNSKRHSQRYREIARIFLRHGFAFLFKDLGPEWQPGRQPGQPVEGDAPSLVEQNLPVHFREALVECGPTFVKLGQFLSTRGDMLPPAYIAELRTRQETTSRSAGSACAIGWPLACGLMV